MKQYQKITDERYNRVATMYDDEGILDSLYKDKESGNYKARFLTDPMEYTHNNRESGYIDIILDENLSRIDNRESFKIVIKNNQLELVPNIKEPLYQIKRENQLELKDYERISTSVKANFPPDITDTHLFVKPLYDTNKINKDMQHFKEFLKEEFINQRREFIKEQYSHLSDDEIMKKAGAFKYYLDPHERKYSSKNYKWVIERESDGGTDGFRRSHTLVNTVSLEWALDTLGEQLEDFKAKFNGYEYNQVQVNKAQDIIPIATERETVKVSVPFFGNIRVDRKNKGLIEATKNEKSFYNHLIERAGLSPDYEPVISEDYSPDSPISFWKDYLKIEPKENDIIEHKVISFVSSNLRKKAKEIMEEKEIRHALRIYDNEDIGKERLSKYLKIKNDDKLFEKIVATLSKGNINNTDYKYIVEAKNVPQFLTRLHNKGLIEEPIIFSEKLQLYRLANDLKQYIKGNKEFDLYAIDRLYIRSGILESAFPEEHRKKYGSIYDEASKLYKEASMLKLEEKLKDYIKEAKEFLKNSLYVVDNDITPPEIYLSNFKELKDSPIYKEAIKLHDTIKNDIDYTRSGAGYFYYNKKDKGVWNVKVPEDKKGLFIGKGGKNIKKLEEKHGVKIRLENDKKK